MQQQQHTLTSSSPFPPNAITTEQIQKYLDENKNLILAILENQNLGKLTECAQYQAILQRNLMYLAAIADAQPQASTVTSQMPPDINVQQENHMQQMQAPMIQQSQVPASRLPFQLNANQAQDQEHQLPQFQQPQQIQGPMGLRPGPYSSMHQSIPPGLGFSGKMA